MDFDERLADASYAAGAADERERILFLARDIGAVIPAAGDETRASFADWIETYHSGLPGTGSPANRKD